jgi:hypothetical protein
MTVNDVEIEFGMGVVALVAGYSDAIQNGRTDADILDYLKGEVTELEEEITADDPGEDGIFGEAIDVMVNCIDLIRRQYPNATMSELEHMVKMYAAKKCDKWNRRYG